MTFRASDLPRHAPLGHTNTGFRRGRSGLTAWHKNLLAIRVGSLGTGWEVNCTKIEAGEAERASHHSQEDLPLASTLEQKVERMQAHIHTYNSGSLFAAFFRTFSELPDLVAVSAALDAAIPNFPATRPAAADMISLQIKSGYCVALGGWTEREESVQVENNFLLDTEN